MCFAFLFFFKIKYINHSNTLLKQSFSFFIRFKKTVHLFLHLSNIPHSQRRGNEVTCTLLDRQDPAASGSSSTPQNDMFNTIVANPQPLRSPPWRRKGAYTTTPKAKTKLHTVDLARCDAANDLLPFAIGQTVRFASDREKLEHNDARSCDAERRRKQPSASSARERERVNELKFSPPSNGPTGVGVVVVGDFCSRYLLSARFMKRDPHLFPSFQNRHTRAKGEEQETLLDRN